MATRTDLRPHIERELEHSLWNREIKSGYIGSLARIFQAKTFAALKGMLKLLPAGVIKKKTVIC